MRMKNHLQAASTLFLSIRVTQKNNANELTQKKYETSIKHHQNYFR